MKNIIVFDNGGETFDRFTIINLLDGEMIGSSERPFAPNGFGQHCGNPAWNYFSKTIGVEYVRNLSIKDPNHYKRIIKRKTAEIVEEFKQDGNIGKLIDFDTLPKDVQQFAKQSFEPVNS